MSTIQLVRVIESSERWMDFVTFDAVDVAIVLDCSCVFLLTDRCLRLFDGVFTRELMTTKNVPVIERLQTRRIGDTRVAHDA
jgi:hypothetical protein